LVEREEKIDYEAGLKIIGERDGFDSLNYRYAKVLVEQNAIIDKRLEELKSTP